MLYAVLFIKEVKKGTEYCYILKLDFIYVVSRGNFLSALKIQCGVIDI